MIEMVTAFVNQQILTYIGASLAVVIATWILKKIPTEKIRTAIYKAFFEVGAIISRFFNNWKYTRKIWENTLEPWLIGFLDMVFVSTMKGLFDGLRSDN